MRTPLTIALLAFAIFSSAAPKALQYKSDVVIDGNYVDWSAPLPFSHKVTGLQYGIANDNKTLYFYIRCTNKVMQQQIVSSGFEIWINMDGKKKKTTGIAYPIPIEKTETANEATPAAGNQAAAPGRNRQGGDDMGFGGGRGGFGGLPGLSTDETTTFVINKDLILTGFLVENGQQLAKSSAVKTAITLDQEGFMLYELAIPFNTFYKEKLDADDAKNPIAFGFCIKKTKLDDNTTNMMRTMRMQMGGMDGGMGGGMMMMGTVNSMTEEKLFWVKFLPTVK
jgi:hypothetical protein